MFDCLLPPDPVSVGAWRQSENRFFCYTATILQDLGFVVRVVTLPSRATKKDAGIKGKRVHNVTDNALVLPRCSLLLFLVAHLSFFSLRRQKAHARELIMVADGVDLAKNNQIARNCAPQPKPHHRAN